MCNIKGRDLRRNIFDKLLFSYLSILSFDLSLYRNYWPKESDDDSKNPIWRRCFSFTTTREIINPDFPICNIHQQ